MASSPVWLITGASSGFGRGLAEEALANGHRVAATLRSPSALQDLRSAYSSDQLLILKLDVTDTKEIDSAFYETKKAFGRVDFVFNNAGIPVVGELEAVPDKMARDVFEVLFWGAANVSRTAVKYFRENEPRGGRLFQITSNFAYRGTPGVGHYSAAKAALEALSESISREVLPEWNIKVVIIAPGPFRTNISHHLELICDPLPEYHPETTPRENFRSQARNMIVDGSVEKVSKTFFKLALIEDPPLHFPVHRDAIQFARDKGQELREAAEKWASWSDDIYLDE